MKRVDEVAGGIYRSSSFVPDFRITFNQHETATREVM